MAFPFHSLFYRQWKGKEEKEDETAAHFPLFLTPSRILKDSVSLQR
jgi:hypothetical protein